MFKKIFISIFFIIIFVFTFSQSGLVVNNSEYNKWIQLGETRNMNPSFFVAVSDRGNRRIDGLYYYDVYLYTNSFYRNVLSPTLIEGVNFLVWENSKWKSVHYIDYIILKVPTPFNNGAFHATIIYSPIRIQSIRVDWKKVDIF